MGDASSVEANPACVRLTASPSTFARNGDVCPHQRWTPELSIIETRAKSIKIWGDRETATNCGSITNLGSLTALAKIWPLS